MPQSTHREFFRHLFDNKLMNFADIFSELTGSTPFPWQEAFFNALNGGEQPPECADIPTGLGKTSVVAIWLAALLANPDKVARRLVYVVNRRTVVDQTTAEVERIRERLMANPELANELKAMCAVSVDVPLALSTLRGQFADNREWSIDPARPAVIVGTVDMIGSGLLFSRYTCGFKTRPHHAALLGQDALLVHDEAHLEPAFQELLDSIKKEQVRCGDLRPLRVLQLSATARNADEKPFGLTEADEQNQIVARRLNAPKQLKLTALSEGKLEDKLVALALSKRDSGRAVLIFARTVEVVQKVSAALKDYDPVVLTGTMRGLERDRLIEQPIFARFLPGAAKEHDSQKMPTCYLIATSAGEVGVNLSAQDLICDLSTYESMAQRFGRVNRFGDETDTVIEVVHPSEFQNIDPDKKGYDPVEAARSRTLDLLRELKGNASPQTLRSLDAGARVAAFSPKPTIRPATDILFDAWAMTSIREPLPGRPPIAPYLHGEAEWQPPETQIAWRTEVELITTALADLYDPEELLAEFPLKPHELLRDRTSRVLTELILLRKELGEEKAKVTQMWLVSQEGKVTPVALTDIADKDSTIELADCTLLLPPCVGGLSSAGLLDGKASGPGRFDLDVSDVTTLDGSVVRTRRFSASSVVQDDLSHLRVKLIIDTWATKEDTSEEDAEDADRYWLWLEAPTASASDSLRTNKHSVMLAQHTSDVEAHARNIAIKLKLDESLSRCLILAAKLHDLGKNRALWQHGIGNYDKTIVLAKAGRKLRPREGRDPYRHEFGSLIEATARAEFTGLSSDEQDLVLHLIAAHHGRARPHFPADECYDPAASFADSQVTAAAVPLRYAHLQLKHGRWGLAYLESLLRAADYAASAEIEPLAHDDHV